MTRLLNDPRNFAAEMLDGLVDANAARVQKVPGGVVRSTASTPGKVALVIGGGSGHYPAFAGLVGHGLADGAAVGDLFASPSAQQIVNVCRAADHGGGILLSFGNYAGDVLNFTLACEELKAEGVDVRIVRVTDDIASASKWESEKRRGIAGGLFVFKVAGAAAEAGLGLEKVETIARTTNARTRSIGVAFAGCTLPGSDHALFEVPEGMLGLGMGIHGEPGIHEQSLPTADELASLMVTRLLAERPPDGGKRAAAVLNGLGATKYEELFVLWRSVSQRLAEAGVTVVEPEVGEYVTSLDMAGCSLSVCWLDSEAENLARWWGAPADASAYRKRDVSRAVRLTGAKLPGSHVEELSRASAESLRSAAVALNALRAMGYVLRLSQDELGRLDAIAGDGDHGLGMTRGCDATTRAARRLFSKGGGAHTVITAAGEAWADHAGGTSGALWGAGIRAFGGAFNDKVTPTTADLARGAEAFTEAIRKLGNASVGDKTMIDAAVPFTAAFAAAAAEGCGPKSAWTRAADEAEAAADRTALLTPKLGRARPLAARSIGSPDPGAISFALCMRAVAQTL
jgi:dihydroxyacetone kinase